MPHIAISPPDPSECVPYFGTYIGLVTGKDVIAALSDQLGPGLAYLRSIPAEKENYQYAPGKWTVKQVVWHIIDTERLFGYRALSFARKDPALLPGMEQDDWMNALSMEGAGLKDLIDEYECVRQSTIHFFKHLSRDAWMRTGTASGNPFTVRSIAYIIAGHELHHMEVLRSRYR